MDAGDVPTAYENPAPPIKPRLAAVRGLFDLARARPGRRVEPGLNGAGTDARRQAGQDPGPPARGGAAPAQLDRRVRRRRPPRPGAGRGWGTRLRPPPAERHGRCAAGTAGRWSQEAGHSPWGSIHVSPTSETWTWKSLRTFNWRSGSSPSQVSRAATRRLPRARGVSSGIRAIASGQ